MFIAEVKQGYTLHFHFSSHPVNKGFLQHLFNATFSLTNFLLFVSDLLFKMAPKFSAEVVSNVSNHKRAVICLLGKMHEIRHIQVGATVPFELLSYSLMLMNQQHGTSE